MVTSLATRATVPAPTAKSLGAARARNGVSISETMTDFRALFAAADQRLDIDALQSLAEGWAEGAESAPPISCTDVYTGLATRSYFQRRVHELSVFGPECSRPHALAIISLPTPGESRSHCWTLLARLGEVVEHHLKGTGASAMFQDTALHVLFAVTERNLARLMECQRAIECLNEGTPGQSRIKFYPLPAAPSGAVPQDSVPEAS
ncbi:hypothetical protein ACIQC5_16535 [Paenarthrobacter sp. NPDC092416]|uniref:hypothetical protein n=1 Tax=Paenarthrobacter sp. NPDC092416 TaxID=3364386 RepID=UPI003804EE49